MANEYHVINNDSYNYHALQIRIGADIWVIKHWLAEDGYQTDGDSDPDAYQIALRKVVLNGLEYIASSNIAKLKDGSLVLLGLNPSTLERTYGGDIVRAYHEGFIDRINQFIIESGEVDTGEDYPAAGTATEKFQWLVENTYLDTDGVVKVSE